MAKIEVEKPKLSVECLCKFILIIKQTHTTVLYAVISPKLRLVRFTLSLLQSCDLREIQLSQKEDLFE